MASPASAASPAHPAPRSASFRSDEVGDITPASGPWGEWKQRIYCSPGMWAVGYQLRTEKPQGGGDDSALNSVKLRCASPNGQRSEWISSYDGLWGTWRSAAECKNPSGRSNNFLKGARVRMEKPQGRGDDTAANDVQFSCSRGGSIHASGGGQWGDWDPWSYCPAGSAVCGLSIRFEPYQGGSSDDSAMNGLNLRCCKLP